MYAGSIYMCVCIYMNNTYMCVYIMCVFISYILGPKILTQYKDTETQISQRYRNKNIPCQI